MTPKDALAKDGKITVKAGRGRMSREAVERCKELAAQGWDIKGYTTVVLSTPTKVVKPVAKAPVTRPTKVVQDYVIFFEEKGFKALDETGKEWSMREVCNNCRVSLVQNHCDNPTIVGDVRVTIVPR